MQEERFRDNEDGSSKDMDLFSNDDDNEIFFIENATLITFFYCTTII